MDINNLPAAYQGTGWQPRVGTLREEIERGQFWQHATVNSEFSALKRVMLFIPHPATPSIREYNTVQHLDRINFEHLSKELRDLHDLYTSFGIKVDLISPAQSFDISKWFYNLFYVRDLFCMTLEGAIIARMASVVRAGEEMHAAKTISSLGIPILKSISGGGTFEGADALWIGKNQVLIGIGNRTNQEGYEQIKYCLRAQNVDCAGIVLPKGIQHLLGMLQIVDYNVAIIRRELFPPAAKDILSASGYKLIELDESNEVKARQSMNIVTLSPGKIIMINGNPKTRELYEKNGLEVAAEIVANELLKGAGGIGCATGILNRESI